MNSDTDSFFTLFTSALSTSTLSILKQSRSHVLSAVWTQCCTAHDDETDDLKLKYCTHCTIFLIYCTNISTNMWKHLRKQHRINVEMTISQVQAATLQQLEQLYLWAELSDQTKKINTQVFWKQLDQDILNKVLILLIIIWNLFFQMIK